MQRTRDGGAEVVKLLKSGSAYYAPSASICEMVDSIVLDQQRVLPAAALLQGEYGLNGLYMGVPCRLGSRGLEHVYEVELTDRGAVRAESLGGRGSRAHRRDGPLSTTAT